MWIHLNHKHTKLCTNIKIVFVEGRINMSPKKKKIKKIKSKPISDFKTANEYYKNSKSKSVAVPKKSKVIHIESKTYKYTNDQLLEIKKNSPGCCKKCGEEEYRDRLCWECYKIEKTES